MIFKRIILPCFLLLVYTLIFPCPQADGSGPIIKIDEPVFHAEQVNQGQVIRHDFKVYNHGTELLEIKDVKPG